MKSPHGVAVNPGSRLGFVANYDDASVSHQLDTDTVTRKIDAGEKPQSIVVDPASGLWSVVTASLPQIFDLQGYRLVAGSTGAGAHRSGYPPGSEGRVRHAG